MNAKDLWLEFLCGSLLPHCGICGNHGYVDTVGKLMTPGGVPCGVRKPCICPNGRAIKKALERPGT